MRSCFCPARPSPPPPPLSTPTTSLLSENTQFQQVLNIHSSMKRNHSLLEYTIHWRQWPLGERVRAQTSCFNQKISILLSFLNKNCCDYSLLGVMLLVSTHIIYFPDTHSYLDLCSCCPLVVIAIPFNISMCFLSGCRDQIFCLFVC